MFILALDRPDYTFTVVCADGSNNVLLRQNIPFTDFPLDEIKLYLQTVIKKILVMLPPEYWSVVLRTSYSFWG